jgi:hypothetical protein
MMPKLLNDLDDFFLQAETAMIRPNRDVHL